MSLPANVHYLTISEIAPLIADGKLSPVELTEAMLDRIKALEPRLNAFATVTAGLARQHAQKAAEEIAGGGYRGPLHGVPIALKDLVYTRGVRTMGGSGIFSDFIPGFDGTVAGRLADSGAVLLGKLNMTEGAMGGYHPDFRYPDNPWREAHWTGSSSSGSGVATAAGLAFATLGSDTGGSIRHPASVCGVVGVKPTWGRVSRHGVMTLAASLDHVGPLARSVRDAGILMQIIAGHDPADVTSLPNDVPDMLGGIGRGASDLRIGYDEQFTFEDLEPSFAEAVHSGVKVFEKLGARIVPIKMPEKLRDYLPAWPILCSAEAAAAHRETYPERADQYGPWLRGWLELGARTSAASYADAHRLRLECSGELALIMRDLDLLAGPATARAAYPVTPEMQYGPIPSTRTPWTSRYTVPHNFAGLPTIVLPAGLNLDGLPVGLQLAAHHLCEPLLFQAGAAFEDATNFHTLHPPI